MAHLAALTAQRDRELLDVSLAQGVLELLCACSAGVYRLVGRDDEPRRWYQCGLARKGCIAVSDPAWIDLHDLPEEAAYPVRRQALAARALAQVDVQATEQDPGGCLAVLPLLAELGPPGVLEVRTEAPLTAAALRPILTLLKVFGNFQNLLESSQRDALTGLLNRQTFDAAFLKASMPLARGTGLSDDRRTNPATGYWLGVVDIDHFKLVNDRFGHLIGDEVLVLMARIMRQSFRHYDRLYRFGGEEFVVLLRGGNESDAHGAFERFRQNVASYPFPQVGQVTVSVGFGEVRHQDSPSGAFKRADESVYTAKHQGRNRVLCFEALVREGVLKSGDAVIGDVELF